MRLGLIVYGSLETQSGGYLYDRKLVEYLRAQGDEVIVFSQPWQAYAMRLAQNLDHILAKQIDNSGLDILLQDELNHPSLFYLNRRWKGKIPLVGIVHHLRVSEWHPGWTKPLYRLIEHVYLNSLDGMIFNSRTTQSAVERLTGSKVAGCVVTPAGDRFGPPMNADDIQERQESSGALRILFVGNWMRRKGLDVLVRALAGLKEREWRLRIVGRSDVERGYAREVLRLIALYGLDRHVDVLGSLNDAELEREFRAAHVLAVPSQYEGFGIVYLEGMGFGLPALAGQDGGAVEVIRPGVDGFLVRPGSVRDVRDCLRVWMDNRPRLKEMSLAARVRYEDFPGWTNGMEQAFHFLHTL